MKKNLFCLLIISQVFVISLNTALGAEKYPSKEIELVVGFAPGGSLDLATRLITNDLGKNLGVPVIVSNRPGAAGASGTYYVVKSKPDGYTMGLVAVSELVLIPITTAKVPYRITDLDPLCKYAQSTTAIYCKGDAPWKTIKDLVADAKNRPGKITYGVPVNSTAHFQMEYFIKTAGIEMLHIPSESSGQTTTRILGGNLDLGITSLATLVDLVKTGKLTSLCVTSPKRARVLPQIPTLKESGYPEPILYNSFGFFLPLGTPKPIRETLEKSLNKTILNPEVEKKLDDLTLALDYSPGESFANEIRERDKQVVEFINKNKLFGTGK